MLARLIRHGSVSTIVYEYFCPSEVYTHCTNGVLHARYAVITDKKDRIGFITESGSRSCLLMAAVKSVFREKKNKAPTSVGVEKNHPTMQTD